MSNMFYSDFRGQGYFPKPLVFGKHEELPILRMHDDDTLQPLDENTPLFCSSSLDISSSLNIIFYLHYIIAKISGGKALIDDWE